MDLVLRLRRKNGWSATALQPGPTAGQELRTHDAVIAAAQLQELEPYYGLGPHGGAAIGFTVLRPYPPGTPPAEVVNGLGRPVYLCALGFQVDPRIPQHAPRQQIRVWAMPHSPHLGARQDPDPSCPECPPKAALDRYAQQAHPLSSEVRGTFTYDIASGRFFRRRRVVTTREILDYAYDCHVRSMGRLFRLRRRARARTLHVLWKATNRFLAVGIWWLRVVYGISTETPERDGWAKDPVHAYGWTDFVERKAVHSATFLGFAGRPRRLLWDLLLWGALLKATYSWWREVAAAAGDLAHPLVVGAAGLAMLLAVDEVGVVLFELAVMGLSRLRRRLLDALMNLDVHVC